MKNTPALQKFIGNMVRTRTDSAGRQFNHRTFGKAVGVSHATVSRWISGTAKDIDDENAERIAELAGISLLELLQISYSIAPNNGMKGLAEESASYMDVYERAAIFLRTKATASQQKLAIQLLEQFGFVADQ